MSEQRQRSESAPAPGAYAVWVPVAVRYSDLDQQGHVNNATYFTYFEQGRLGYFDTVRRLARAAVSAPLAAPAHGAGTQRTRAVDVAPAATDDRLELPLVVSEAGCVYRRPIASLAPVCVGVRAARIGHASIILEYEIRAAPDGPLYATGSTTIVCVDPISGRPRGLPAWTVAALRQMEASAHTSAIAEDT
jgi:acyl-CoA thioester hydrolase